MLGDPISRSGGGVGGCVSAAFSGLSLLEWTLYISHERAARFKIDINQGPRLLLSTRAACRQVTLQSSDASSDSPLVSTVS